MFGLIRDRSKPQRPQPPDLPEIPLSAEMAAERERLTRVLTAEFERLGRTGWQVGHRRMARVYLGSGTSEEYWLLSVRDEQGRAVGAEFDARGKTDEELQAWAKGVLASNPSAR